MSSDYVVNTLVIGQGLQESRLFVQRWGMHEW